MSNKLLYINIDGFSHSYLRRLRAEGKAGVFDALAKDGMYFENLSSGLVSITNPMQSAILCGAFSEKTHNFYQHYDKELREVIKHKRTFDAENVAEVFLRHGKTVVSIHQFMLEDNPCVYGDKKRAYITCPNQPSNFKDRFALLKRIARGESVRSGDVEITYDEFPDFLALYIDDVDSLGHNNAYGELPIRANFEERQKDIIDCLIAVQEELREFIEICKRRGIYDDLTVLITADHGMTPFFGKSSLSEVLDKINALGISAATAENVTCDTEVVALPYTIELSLYYIKPLTAAKQARLTELLSSLDFVDKVFSKEEMRRDFGFDERGPELLISPKRGFHFYKRDYAENTFGASHDSFDESAQHVFGLLFGNNIAKTGENDERISVISLLPSILKANFGYTLSDATAPIIKIS